MSRDCFIRLCTLFTVQNHIQETHTLTAHEQLMLFLMMVTHGDSNRRSAYEWKHSTETVSGYFDVIWSHLVDLATQFIVRLDLNAMSPVIATNGRFYPYFQVCGFCYEL